MLFLYTQKVIAWIDDIR